MNRLYIERSSRRLNEAVRRNDVELVRDLLESGINVNTRGDDEHGNGVLYNSVLSGNLEITELLLEHGAYVDDSNYQGFRAFDMALLMGRAEHLELLLKYGARANINTFYYVITNQERRRDVDLMYQLVDLRDRDKNGLSILHLAVMYDNNLDGLIMLLAKGARVNERTLNDGQTSLHLAAKAGKTDFVELLLLHGAKTNLKDEFGFTALHKAVSCESNEHAHNGDKTSILKMLLDAGARVNEVSNNGLTALHMAARSANVKCMELLLQYGAELNLKDNFGCTPLYAVASYSRNYRLDVEYHMEAMKLLLDAKADVNESNNEGITPLHIFALRAQPKCVRLLLSYGAQVDLRDSHGFTPLHVVSSLRIHEVSKANQIKVSVLLLDHGADINHVANNGKTPLHCARDSNAGGVIRTLLEYVARYWNIENQDFLPGGELNLLNAELISNSPRWSDYFNECKLEVERMQLEIFVGEASIRDFLIRKSRALTSYAKNPKVIKFENPSNSFYFPIYYTALRKKLREIRDIRKLQDNAASSLSVAMQSLVDPKNVVTQKIISMLNLRDLKNLAISFRPGQEVPQNPQN